LKKRKKRISHRESIAIRINKVEEELQIRYDHFKYIEETNWVFKNPKLRVEGEDTRRYKRDMPILEQELKSLKKYYHEKWGNSCKKNNS
jgi:hypothetical protein